MIRIRPQTARYLYDRHLQEVLRTTMATAQQARDEAVAEVENWEELRNYARQVKLHTLAHLGDYLEALADRISSRGGRVFWAETAEDACNYVVETARRHSARTVVKSKTMLGEEIGINTALQKAGVEPVETDLGEFIVQLCQEPPFHIITPAFHKTRQDVARIFTQHLGQPLGEDPEELTAAARKALREKFLQADLGITGVNLAVADSGHLVVVENEGNARLSLSAPPVHIALMGIEKVIPRLQDLPVFLKLLTRSATGQRITSYVNLIGGPRCPEEVDGPEEFHLVLVDNGRSRILADERKRETLACIRCGACLNVCPVYGRIGGHAYRTVYQGPVGAVLMPQLLGPEQVPEHPFASTLCEACRDICPVKIDIPRLLLELRRELPRRYRRGDALAMRVWAWTFENAGRYAGISAWGRRLLRLFYRDGRLALPLPVLGRWQSTRDLPRLPNKTFYEEFSNQSADGGGNGQ
ncbi:MAG TPA: LutB/LldF family L-lactate oxidation iron-sulfur protein [Acidobacteriota bacterium]|nr:LutB/LldF family L-lactate oxidation iron-sulfur protein [Acidobacteriota bacterium]HRR25515.1 LutB/LldF family L-lactate oxidation iron-sulfur protein [Acidobacteriota bacterium]HRV07339.1 LutB/LldF family L-lactate oxidation iron-sulfur protein [Acidobacteriota bacterium]